MSTRSRQCSPALARLESRLLNERFYGPGLRFCLERLGSLDGKRVLEIGCGTGELSLLLALRGAQVTGIDVRGQGVARARLLASRLGAAETCEFVRAKAEDFPLRDRSVDVVISKSTLQYMDRRLVLERCIRALAPTGALALNENLPRNPFIRVFRDYRSMGARLGFRGDYVRSIRGYFSADDLRWLSDRFMSVEHRDSHLGRVLVSPHGNAPETRAGQHLDVAVGRLDEWLLRRAHKASGWAWLTAVVAQHPIEAVNRFPVGRG